MESENRKSLKWREGERFINPYNFIPLEDKVERGFFSVDYEDSHTGYFDCSLELLTPLIIPNTSCNTALHTKDELERANAGSNTVSYDFFSYEDLSSGEGKAGGPYEPVIPGSEIRGAVRSVYEAVFKGCMSAVSGERTLGRRCIEPKMAGILKKQSGEWKLYPCYRSRLAVENENKGSATKKFVISRTEYDRLSEGELLYVEIGPKSVIRNYMVPKQGLLCPKGWEEGYLHKGEDISKKKYESVFIKIKKNGIQVSLSDLEMLKKVLEEYGNKKKNRLLESNEHTGYKEYNIDKIEFLPVYYTWIENKPFYLSPACIGKELFDKTVEALLKDNGGFQPCNDLKEVCPACSVFGMISGKNGKNAALASRLRFTDALLINKSAGGYGSDYYMNPIVLPELGEPKPGTAEFYTYPPYNNSEKRKWKFSQGYWTYDYYCIKSKVNNTNRVMMMGNRPKLRGRKYYWHSDEWKSYVDNGYEELTAMKQKVRPLKPDSRNLFKFRVYFENFSHKELQRIKWSLDFNDAECAHKIGRAKPLGFGSVKIHVDELRFRDINTETGAWEMSKQNLGGLLTDFTEEKGEAVEALKIMANWVKRPGNLGLLKRGGNTIPVCYPKGEDTSKKGDNASASHQWFAGNRNRSQDSNNMQPVFAKILPEVKDEVGNNEEKWLYKLIRK